jgi:cytochrome c
MDSFELNKIIGAILGTLLFVMGVGFLAEAVYAPRATGPGLSLPVPEGSEHGTETEAPAAAVPIGVLLASADAAAGENAAKKCQSCHNFASGAGNKTGPELYDVVERVIGSHPGFAYSPVMVEHQAAGDTWTYDQLNAFLLAPKDAMPGTKMNFSGLKNDSERANVIAYLATLSASPKSFPPAEAAAAPAPEGTAPVATEGDATATPTETQGETAVEGTATTSGTEGAAAAAPPEPAAPAAH